MQSSRMLLNTRVFATMALVAVLAFTVVYPATDQRAVAQTTVDICDRTPQIEEAILRRIAENNQRPACDAVTDEQLAAITSIDVSGDRLGSVVTGLKADDLSDLTSLESFSAANSRIGMIPVGFFADNSDLTIIDLAVAQIKSDDEVDGLPAALFDHLTSLTTLRLERNYFMSMPPALSATSMAKLTELWTFTIGMDWPNHWHFQTLPTDWIKSIPTGLTELKLGNIRLSNTDAQYIAENFTKLMKFEFDYQDLTFAKFTVLMDALVDISTTMAPMDDLHMTASGDAKSGCVTGSNPNSIGSWYSDNPTEIAAFKTALSGLRVNKLTIFDPRITAVAAEDILGTIDKPYTSEIHFECGSMDGFAGNSLVGYTNLQQLQVRYSDLTVDDFQSIVSNLNINNSWITQLDLHGNDFDGGDSYVDLTLFDFSDILDSLRTLDYDDYFSCEGPWIADYETAGFWLQGRVYSITPGTQVKPFIVVSPIPTEEPEDCVEPVEPEPVAQEEEEVETEPNWPPATIMSIEPAVNTIKIWTGKYVVLSTNVYGVQNILDNRLADAVSPDDVWFDWEEENSQSDFAESTNQKIRINNLPDDRNVMYRVPSVPGNYRVSVNVPFAAHCKGPRAEIGETEEEAIARCSAEFELIVRNQRDTTRDLPAPVNPEGVTPKSVANNQGRSCPTFTPEEGGVLTGNGYAVAALPGAVQNNEAIAICVDKAGPASNAGQIQQRFTLHGDVYAITAYDINGRTLSNYSFNLPIEACSPLPETLRNRITDVDLTVINGDRSLTVLQSTTAFSSTSIAICGNLGGLPARVAVGAKGAPTLLPTPVAEDELPDTGATAPPIRWVLLVMIVGLAVTTLNLLRSRRPGLRS